MNHFAGEIVTPPLPQYAFMAWCSIKAKGKLYLYLTFMMSDYKELRKKLCVCVFKITNTEL